MKTKALVVGAADRVQRLLLAAAELDGAKTWRKSSPREKRGLRSTDSSISTTLLDRLLTTVSAGVKVQCTSRCSRGHAKYR
jgi:hypothetical protein